MKQAIVMILLISAAVARGQGGLPLWTNRYNPYGENHSDEPTAIATDSSGNVFVTGYSQPLSSLGEDYATLAYSGAGVPLWTNRYSGGDANAIAVDHSGNVFVTGGSFGSGGSWHYTTVAYSNAGMPLWTRHYARAGNNTYGAKAYAIAVDSRDNVFVAGSSEVTDGVFSYATVAYSGGGAPLWTNYYTAGNGRDGATAIAVDASGSVFVTGRSDAGGRMYDYATVAYSGTGLPLWTNLYNAGVDGRMLFPSVAIVVDHGDNVFVTGPSFNGANFDYSTVAYSNLGIPLWTNCYNGTGNGDDFPGGIAVNTSGNVFVTGSSDSGNRNFDFVTIAYSGAGVPLWTNRYNGPGNGNDGASAIAVDRDGNVFVTGWSDSGNGNSDFVTIAYSGAGVPLWTNRYDGPGSGNAIAVDIGGNVIVAGDWRDSGGSWHYATIKYSSSVPAVHLDFQKIENELVLKWTNAAFGLQSAPVITGTFTNVPGAASPYTNAFTGAQKYYRLKKT